MPVHTGVGQMVLCSGVLGMGMEMPLSKGVFTSYLHCSRTRKREEERNPGVCYFRLTHMVN